MPDYGLQLLNSMYSSGPSQVEKKNMEFTRLQQMQSFFENERKKKEEASMKMQLYDENVAKFADTLLAADRNKIYQKSRVLKQSIRDMIKENGGDMKSFFANGGHEVMANYKSSLIQSEESSQYMENKQNMAFVLKAMNEGKGHLISPVDKANFDNYFKNNGGKITYSGIMNDIKMPDASKYSYGQVIPVQDILNENRTTILSNYAIYHRGTSNDPAESGKLPSEADLLAFTASMYGTTKGSNYQERIARNTEKIQWNQEMRTQQNQPYEVAGKILQNEQAAATIDATKANTEGQRLQNEKTELEILNANAGLSASGNGNGGPAGSGSVVEGMKDIYGLGTGETTDEYSTFTDLSSSLNDYNATAGNAWSAANAMIKGNNFFGTVLNGSWKGGGATQYNFEGTSFFDGSPLASGKFTPTAAFDLFKTNGEKNALAAYAAAQVGSKFENGVFKNFAPKKGMAGVYSADGTSIQNGHGTLFKSSDFSEDYAGDYKVVGTIMAAKLYDPKNGEQIIMNKDGKLAKNGYNATDKARMSAFAVIEKNGNRFYVEVDPSNMQNVQNLHKAYDVTKATNQTNFTRGKQNQVKSAMAASKQEYQTVRNQIRQNPSFQSVARQISPDGTYGDVALLDSFYMTLKSSIPNMTYDQIVNNHSNSFLSLINEANSSLPNETGGNLVGRLKSGSISPQQFFMIMSKSAQSPQDKQIVQQWYDTYKNIKYNK